MEQAFRNPDQRHLTSFSVGNTAFYFTEERLLNRTVLSYYSHLFTSYFLINMYLSFISTQRKRHLHFSRETTNLVPSSVLNPPNLLSQDLAQSISLCSVEYINLCSLSSLSHLKSSSFSFLQKILSLPACLQNAKCQPSSASPYFGLQWTSFLD